MTGDRMPAALGVGYGVPQTRSRPDKKFKPAGVVPDLPDDWSDTPTISGQINNPELWRVKDEEVKVFDLTQAEDIKQYNELLTCVNQVNTNKLIRDRKTEAFPAISGWKVLVHVVTIEFRKILKTEKPK
jgi:hypothetical protein